MVRHHHRQQQSRLWQDRSAAHGSTHQLWNGDDLDSGINARLVDRDAHFGQSYGRFNVKRSIQRKVWWRFYASDWFHSLINTKWYRIAFAVIISYLLLFTVFACFYVEASDACLIDVAGPFGQPGSHEHERPIGRAHV